MEVELPATRTRNAFSTPSFVPLQETTVLVPPSPTQTVPPSSTGRGGTPPQRMVTRTLSASGAPTSKARATTPTAPVVAEPFSVVPTVSQPKQRAGRSASMGTASKREREREREVETERLSVLVPTSQGSSPASSLQPAGSSSDGSSPTSPATTTTDSEEDAEYRNNPDVKPPFSYASLIAQAINSTKEKRLTLSNIYQWIMTTYPFYSGKDSGWQNSIRHNLSLNKCFIKIPRAENEPGKGAFWGIDPKFADQFSKGVLRKRRSRVDDHANVTAAATAASIGSLKRRHSTSGLATVSDATAPPSPPQKRSRRPSTQQVTSDETTTATATATADTEAGRAAPRRRSNSSTPTMRTKEPSNGINDAKVTRVQGLDLMDDNDNDDDDDDDSTIEHGVMENRITTPLNTFIGTSPMDIPTFDGFRFPTSDFRTTLTLMPAPMERRTPRPPSFTALKRYPTTTPTLVSHTGFALLDHASARAWGVRPSTSGTATPDLPDFDFHSGSSIPAHCPEEMFIVNDCFDQLDVVPSMMAEAWEAPVAPIETPTTSTVIPSLLPSAEASAASMRPSASKDEPLMSMMPVSPSIHPLVLVD